MDTLYRVVSVVGGITAAFLGLMLAFVFVGLPFPMLRAFVRTKGKPVWKRAIAFLVFATWSLCLAVLIGALTVLVIAILARDPEIQSSAWDVAAIVLLPSLLGLPVYWQINARLDVAPDWNAPEVQPMRSFDEDEFEPRTPLLQRPGCLALGLGAFLLLCACVCVLNALGPHDLPRQRLPAWPAYRQPWQEWLMAILLAVLGIWSLVVGVRQWRSGSRVEE